MIEFEGGVGCVFYFCGVVVISNVILLFVVIGDYLLMIGLVYELV